MPILRGSAFGDLYIRINTQVPTSLTKKKKFSRNLMRLKAINLILSLKVFLKKLKVLEEFIINEHWSNNCNFSCSSISFNST